MSERNAFLVMAGTFSCLAALTHLGIILGGPDWYRFFGAGEQMALMAEAGMLYPSLVTLAIAGVLFFWGLYAFSGAGLIRRLPLLKWCLLLIAAVFSLRGVAGLLVPFIPDNPYVAETGATFWLVSSAICLAIGLAYGLGIRHSWFYINRASGN